MSGLCLCFMKQGSDSVSNISMQTIPIVNEKTGRKFNSCKEDNNCTVLLTFLIF